jgi:hypothetical protein
LNCSYIQRSVDSSIFEDFKKLSIPLSKSPTSVIENNDELDIDESLMFLIYELMTRGKVSCENLEDIDVFKRTLKEIVDELYSGPAVDYVVLNLEKK